MKLVKFTNLILIIASTLPLTNAYAGKSELNQNCSQAFSGEQSKISADLQQELQSSRAHRKFTVFLLVQAQKIDSVIERIDQMGDLSGSVKQLNNAWTELEARGTKKAVLALLNNHTEFAWAGSKPLAQDQSQVKTHLVGLREKLKETPGYNMFTLDRVDGSYTMTLFIYEGSDTQKFNSLIADLPLSIDLKVTTPGYPRYARALSPSFLKPEEIRASLLNLGVKSKYSLLTKTIEGVFETREQEEAVIVKFGKRMFEPGPKLASPALTPEEEQALIDSTIL